MPCLDYTIRFEEITSVEAVAYEDALKKKGKQHIYLSMDVCGSELRGVMTAELTEALSGEETAELMNLVVGQYWHTILAAFVYYAGYICRCLFINDQ